MNKPKCKQRMPAKEKQRGSVLAISLIILLILTVLGVNSMSALTLEERMASHTRQSMVASQSAEIALRAAETRLVNDVKSEADLSQFEGGNAGLYSQVSLGVANPPPVSLDIYDDSTWSDANSAFVPGIADIDPDGVKGRAVSRNPRYIIEYLGRFGQSGKSSAGGKLDIVNDPNPKTRDAAFRVTAIGWGETQNARFLAQSTFRIDL